METILIPIDFSEVSKSAAEYAFQFAKERNASMILLHVFQIPVYSGNDPVFMPPFDELENSNVVSMKKFETAMREKFKFTQPIENITKSGFLIDEITDIVKEKDISLIIMGISEAGRLSEILLSSNSIGVIKNTKCPTLIVPEGAVYRPINTIVFACDDIKKIEESQALKQITEFVNVFDSKILVLTLIDSFENLNNDVLVEAKKEVLFQNIRYSIHFIEGQDLVKNINGFIEKHNADLLIMIPRKHTVFSKLFHESTTKRMAFNAHIPLLAVHE